LKVTALSETRRRSHLGNEVRLETRGSETQFGFALLWFGKCSEVLSRENGRGLERKAGSLGVRAPRTWTNLFEGRTGTRSAQPFGVCRARNVQQFFGAGVRCANRTAVLTDWSCHLFGDGEDEAVEYGSSETDSTVQERVERQEGNGCGDTVRLQMSGILRGV
jgi:hypothetical protein